MEMRWMGKTDLKVTALGYGAMELSRVDEKQAAQLLNEALDGGINFIDTSPCYKLSEEYIGKAISHRRSEFYLATKCGCNLSGEGPRHIFDRKTLLYNLDNSLKLLKTDYIDIWQLHTTQPGELAGDENDEVIETMLELKKQGKIRYIGISFKNGSQQEALYPVEYSFRGIKEFINWDVFDVMQTVYGGLTRKCETAITKAAEKEIGIIVRGVVKKYFEEYDMLFKNAKLHELFESEETQNSFLIRFALNHPGVSTMIIGTKSSIHLQENIKAVERGKLSEEIYTEAKKRLDSIGVTSQQL